MRRRTYLAGALGVLTAIAGCNGDSSNGESSPEQSQSGLRVASVSVIEYKPKDYDERPKVAGTLEVEVGNAASETITVDGVRITGDIPDPHDEQNLGAFSVPSEGAMDKVGIDPRETQRLQIESKPLYYVDLSSEGDRTQEELSNSTCTGMTRSATLHFKTADRGTIRRNIKMRFGGESVEFDEMAPDYGCTDVTIVNG